MLNRVEPMTWPALGVALGVAVCADQRGSAKIAPLQKSALSTLYTLLCTISMKLLRPL